MTTYNLILEDTIIEDIPLEEAMSVAQMYAELEAGHKDKVKRFGYEYRILENGEYRIVATIEKVK